MKKIELLDNETFTIKGVYGETYVFDGDTLFIDSSNVSRKAVVLKSLRTRAGAESWLNSVGKSFSNAQIFDTNSLREFEGRVVTRKSIGSEDEDEDFDATMPFHVVATSDDEGGPQADEESGEGQDMDEIMEDEEQEQDMSMTQIAQILHDAEKLYEMIEQEEHLEPWMQAKLTKVAEYVSAIAENLEHDEGNIPSEDGDGEDMPSSRIDDDEDDNDDFDPDKLTSLPPLPKTALLPKEALDDIVKSVLKNIAIKSEETARRPGGMSQVDTDQQEARAGEPDEPAAPDKPEGTDFEKSITGKIFKSLNAARQWNRFENPDKDRYYIDIMREKDVRKSFSKSSGLNAKYVVRDRWEEEEETMKGAHGNKIVKGLKEKRIDPATRTVAAIRKG